MAACKVCEEPLVMSVDDESDEGTSTQAPSETVPDDLRLPCDCHFHWQCLLDHASSVISSLTCPSCNTLLAPSSGSSSSSSSSSMPAILTTYASEGGTEENLDIVPVLKEEAYLEAHPEARPARALHIMASGGDVHGAVELLHSIQEDFEPGDSSLDTAALLIRYQDPLAGMKSALHLAAEAEQESMVWLLLWLSSSLPEAAFPDESRALAEAIGLGRLEVSSPEQDVRSLRDADGNTPESFAQRAQVLLPLLQSGVLSPQA